MNDLNNTIMTAYSQGFAELSFKARFHLSSRLYLWCQNAQAHQWLEELRPNFTADDKPLVAVRRLLEQPVPPLSQTAAVRAPYFARHPALRQYEIGLFRLLFLRTVYGLETRELVDVVFTRQALDRQRDDLLNDPPALAILSSFGLNFLYLLERFGRHDDSSLPLDDFLRLGQTGFDSNDVVSRQLQCYFYTHCIIAESLFYARRIPLLHQSLYRHMLAETEQLIEHYFADTKLDIKCEFLVCCRILGQTSHLETRILEDCTAALTPEGFLAERRSSPLQRPATLQGAEHRNVLFMMSQQAFRPLF